MKFQVIVGNIGTVYDGNNFLQAHSKFTSYVKLSKKDVGRASGETVTLMHDNEPRKEFIGKIDQSRLLVSDAEEE